MAENSMATSGGANPPDTKQLDEIVRLAQSHLSALNELIEQAKCHAVAIASTNEVAAEKLTEIAAQVETAKKTCAQIAATQEESLKVLGEKANQKLVEVAGVSTQAAAAMTQITDNQAIIATKSDHIQKAQEHADKVRADLDRVLTAAKQQATETEGLRARAQSATDSATSILTETKTTKGSVDADAAKIATALKHAEESDSKTKALADKAAKIEEQIKAYEARLKEFDEQYGVQLKKIVDLLPGATTVGLAHSFDDRRKKFLNPVKWWQWLFVGSVLCIVLLTITGLWNSTESGVAPSYDELFRLWLVRLPVVGALVWLALYSSRESALAKRLEEDYGYKAAISSCFEGFQKQMSEVGKGVSPDSALAKLLDNTLAIIAAPPGRIYESHKLTV